MKKAFNHIVFEEMFYVTGGCIPAGAEALTEIAYQNHKVAALLPFYMYCFFPHEWQEYTLFTAEPLPPALNHATNRALMVPELHADRKIKRFFNGAAAIADLPEDHLTEVPLKDRIFDIFRQYQLLCSKTRLLLIPDRYESLGTNKGVITTMGWGKNRRHL